MSYRFSLYGSLFSLALIILFSCTKVKETDIGAALLPAVDNVNTFDTTLEVVANTFFSPDSLLPRMGRDATFNAGNYLLGYISDNPVFGRTKASVFLELKPISYPFFFENKPDSLFLDSVVLSLRWNMNYGDTNALQSIAVHRITEKLRNDSAYATNKNVQIGQLLGSKLVKPSELDDSLFLFRQNTSKQLRIRLSDDFGRELLKTDTVSQTSPYRSDSLFREAFRGFALVPQQTGQAASANALMSFAMSDTATQLRIYYRFQKDGKIDTTSTKFVFTNITPGASVNQIVRDYSASQVIRYVNKPGGDSLVYIQNAPGTYAMLRIPGIQGFKSKKGNVMVHLAQLTADEVMTQGRRSDLFLTPTFLYPDIYDSVNNKFVPFLADGFQAGSFDPFLLGTQRKYVTETGGQIRSVYNLTLTRYIQGIITRNNPNFPIRLAAPYRVSYNDLFINFQLNGLANGEVVLGGGNHSSKKMKLRLVYSTL